MSTGGTRSFTVAASSSQDRRPRSHLGAPSSSATRTGIPRAQLQARYGDTFNERLKQWFERDGLVYNPPPEVVPNTMQALRVTELARGRGLHEPVHDRLMQAYWEEARNIGDPEELR